MPRPEVRIYVDGGARGNPGPAGFGILVADAGDQPLGRYFGYLGVATNNVAEYRGLLAALEHARHRGWRRLWVGSDSELMVRQMRGEYRVKNQGLRPLFERCREILSGLEEFTIEHLPRERNAEADRLANRAMNLRESDLPPGAGGWREPSGGQGGGEGVGERRDQRVGAHAAGGGGEAIRVGQAGAGPERSAGKPARTRARAGRTRRRAG